MNQRTFVLLVVVAITGHLLDVFLTAVGLCRGFAEYNPVQLAIYRSSGLFGMALDKVVLVSLVIALLWRMRLKCPPWQVALAALCLAVPALAVSMLNALTINGS